MLFYSAEIMCNAFLNLKGQRWSFITEELLQKVNN